MTMEKTLKLYHSPGACSLGILILLEEIGVPYDVQITDLKKAEHSQPAFLAANPKGKVPALALPDGSILTEFPVIAYWLAKAFPSASLLPEELAAQIRVLEMTEYIVSTLHMRGSVFAIHPQKFTRNADAQVEIRQHGQQVVRGGFERLRTQLAGKPVLFDRFSIADAAAFYLLSWRDRIGLDLGADLEGYFSRLQLRPSIARALRWN